VYADGNGMGRLIKEIEEPEQFEFFSMTVDQAIREACYEALWKFCRPCFPAGAEAGEEKIPADILLLGGDDLMVYLAADRALDFALMVAQEFEARTQAAFANAAFFKEKLKGKGVTISLGIAYGKSHTPFAVILDQAGELLKTAKAKGATDPTATELYSPSYLDYHFTSFFNQLSVQNCRQAHLTFTSPHRLRLYQKPYSLEDAQKLRDWARELVRSGIPRSRRHRLGTAAYLGKPNGTLEFLKAFVRSKEEHRPIIRRALEQFGCFGQHLPWNLEADNSFSTVLVDLIELTELSS
jgi:hypothetical protein